MPTEEWSRVPARDAIGLLVRFSTRVVPEARERAWPDERYELFVAVLELVRVEALLPYFRGQVGRPEEDRAALARAFMNVPTTRGLIERLEVDGRLCRLCGLPAGFRARRSLPRAVLRTVYETLIARTMEILSSTSRGMRRRSRRGRRRRRSRRQRSRSGASGGGHARERRGRRSRAGWNGN